MTYHVWGDGFDFDMLYEAELFLAETYYKLSNKRIISKEKYGTLRYEFSNTWAPTKEDERLFGLALLATVRKYPGVAAEIVDDAITIFDEGWDLDE